MFIMSSPTTSEPVPRPLAGDRLVRFGIPLWIAGGALLKFFTGRPDELPALMSRLPVDQSALFLVVIAAELVIAAMIALHRGLARPLALAVLSVFMVVLVTQWATGSATCGCLGAAKIPTWVMIIIDGVLLAGVLLLPRRRGVPPATPARMYVLTAVSVVLIAGVFGGFHLGAARLFRDHRAWLVLEPASWVGREFARTQLAGFMPMDAAGQAYSPRSFPEDDQIWVLYRRTCPHCHALFRERYATVSGRRIIAVDLSAPPGQDEPAGESVECPECVRMYASAGRDVVARVPIVIRVRAGIIVSVEQAY
jgi:ribosomal protein L34